MAQSLENGGALVLRIAFETTVAIQYAVPACRTQAK